MAVTTRPPVATVGQKKRKKAGLPSLPREFTPNIFEPSDRLGHGGTSSYPASPVGHNYVGHNYIADSEPVPSVPRGP